MSCASVYPETTQKSCITVGWIYHPVSYLRRSVEPLSILLHCCSAWNAAQTRNSAVSFQILFYAQSGIWIPDQVRDDKRKKFFGKPYLKANFLQDQFRGFASLGKMWNDRM